MFELTKIFLSLAICVIFIFLFGITLGAIP